MRGLWDKAREYGRVMLYTHEDGDVSCTIKFNCLPGTTLEANSGYKNSSPEDALAKALFNAQRIVEEFRSNMGRLPHG